MPDPLVPARGPEASAPADRPPASVRAGAVAGAIGGAAAGVMNALWAWGAAAQFVPGLGARLRLVLMLGASYALVGALGGAALVAGVRLGRIGAPRRPGHTLALSVVTPPLLIAALWLAHRGLLPVLKGRKDFSLTLLVMLVGAVGAAAGAIGLACVAARPLEAPLARVSRRSAPLLVLLAWTAAALIVGLVTLRLTPALAASAAVLLVAGAALVMAAWRGWAPPPGLGLALVTPPVVVGALLLTHALLVPVLATGPLSRALVTIAVATVAALTAASAVAWLVAARLPRAPGWAPRALLAWAVLGGVVAWRWSVARKVDVTPALAAGVIAVLAVGAWPRVRRRRAPLAALLGGGLALLAATLLAGNDPAVVQASDRFSGLGGPIAAALRKPIDRDRDGFSPLLGGGDCDDGDARVHPGALEIPGDGIDQNCAGGDAAATALAHDLGFVPVPATVPADANIVLITIDTLRADHLGAYGYGRPTSPTIDAIAAGGTRFANAWAHAPSTRYSMPALLTGRLPLDVFYDTSIDGWPGLLPRATTIAEGLSARGFATGAITNYWYFDEVRRMNQGFASYDNKNKRLHVASGSEGPKHTRGSSSREQTDKAVAFVDANAARRFFLWVHYYDPHSEYEAHPEVPSFGSAPVDLYDGEIRFTDLQLGRLVDELKARGLYDKTIFVITGDHGEGFGEHGIDLHGYHLYAAQTKVPLIIRVPGLAPRVSATPAGHIDVMPTLLNLAGVAATDASTHDLMGRSLVDVLAGAPDVDRPVFQQLSYEGNHEMRAAASQRCHVIYNVSPTTSWETYRVDRDPAERDNLDADAAGCGETKRQLEAWHDAAQIPPGAIEALLPGAPSIAAPLGVRFGPELELLAVELPAQAKAGDVVTATWTFAAHGTLAGGWKVFAHFENGRGGTFRGDHEPARPFAWWKAGQFIRYQTDVAIPRSAAPGRYDLWAGVWKGAARRPAAAPAVEIVDNRAKVGGLEVVR